MFVNRDTPFFGGAKAALNAAARQAVAGGTCLSSCQASTGWIAFCISFCAEQTQRKEKEWGMGVWSFMYKLQ